MAVKKIGLLTFHFPINYGALLQTYALKQYLSDKGYNVYTVNYFTKEQISDYTFWGKIKTIKGFCHYLLKIVFSFYYLNKRRKFRRFQLQHFALTKHYDKIEKVNFEYDVVLTGSDQVFNITKKSNLVYYQPFKKQNGQKKIAYSPSFGIDPESFLYKKDIIELLSDFDSLSCRETTGAAFMERVLDREIPSVVDPVYLLSKEEWEVIASKDRIKDDYILIYDLNGKENLIKIAQKISGTYKIVIVSTDYLAKLKYSRHKVYKIIIDAGIEEFIGLIKNAEYVITDSFHGISMSVIFGKKFYCFIALEKAAGRILSLLQNLSLETRIIRDIDKISVLEGTIENYHKCLTNLINKSKLYLNKSLDE